VIAGACVEGEGQNLISGNGRGLIKHRFDGNGGKGAARSTLTYHRKKGSGAYENVYNIVFASDGMQR
jgi:hypothetical protein